MSSRASGNNEVVEGTDLRCLPKQSGIESEVIEAHDCQQLRHGGTAGKSFERSAAMKGGRGRVVLPIAVLAKQRPFGLAEKGGGRVMAGVAEK